MRTLTELVFTGKWRSFKIFQPSGGIDWCTMKKFQEFSFTPDHHLVIKKFTTGVVDKLADTIHWSIDLDEKKHILHVEKPKMDFEVVTVNHMVLVLQEPSTGEKIYFSKEATWPSYIKSNQQVIF